MENLVQPEPLPPVVTALRTGQRAATEVAARSCARIEAVDGAGAGTGAGDVEAGADGVHAFVPEAGRRERLLAEARAVAERWPDPADRPPLYGVPVGVKDVVRVDGLPTGAGSALPAEVLAGQQAPVVDRLRAAGALVAGKTVTAEFAVTAPGPTRNPHHLAHTPGGSSSGSAAAVAAGMVPLAVGTQTVGSVIRPAAFCGVVGFKPTYGRIPTDGVIANAPTFDTLGLFGADVASVALAAAVVCDGWHGGGPPAAPGTAGREAGGRGAHGQRTGGPDAADPGRGERGLPRLGIPDGPYLDHVEPGPRAAFEAWARRLEAAGYRVRRVPFMADFDRIVTDHFTVNRYETARVHADWFPRFGDRYREQTVNAVREGQRIADADYRHALDQRQRFRDRLAATMDDAGLDLWIAPSAPGPAPYGIGSTGKAVVCLPWSFAGVPVVGLPAGTAENGLPLGMQCVARLDADERLLGWAVGVEHALAGRAAGTRGG